MNFKRTNNFIGWIVFLIATGVYLMTMERTGSLWDCGEFASCAYKIQLPHPPGAPLFVLIGRLFMIPFDPQHAAIGLNSMSAIASGFTILFLFWSITHFARKIVESRKKELEMSDIILTMAAGVVGALAYTFSDSFWFSAVEGEVYALSSFFTALVFWLALKWEQNVCEEQAQGITGHFTKADRWLILIFYLMGLSIGVHLLNLLTIPAIIIIYYFKRYKATVWGTIIAFLIGCAITGIAQKAIIQWSIKGAGNMDVWFVNNNGLPFFSGFTFFFILIAGLLGLGLYLAHKNSYNFLKLAFWSTAFMFMGFSSYFTTMIRSNANPSIDMYNVDNPVSLVGYLSREQYGDWPILYGNDFTETPPQKEGSTYWTKGKDEYHDQGSMVGYDYSEAENAHFFPRMWEFNNDRNSHSLYRTFGHLDEGETPTMFSNIRYFMSYQMGVMYFRYFMWNFAGKQNDIQGFGNSRDGNSISGITPVDNLMSGVDQDKLPDSISKNNKAHNKLFYLPLILGMMGLVYQLKSSKKDFLVNGLFFFFTGIAIVLYLNQSGMQPRERDYAYVGSFYAFAIWIGLGVMLVADLLNMVMKSATSQGSIIAGVVCFLAVPMLMANQEWDDHDRSKKTIARDLAIDYLESCPKNAILISFGDNDTYPLWYAQEVEGIRTDVRVINYSLLSSDWYYTQLGQKVNNSEAIDAIFNDQQVEGNNRAAVFVTQKPGYNADTYYNLYDILKNYTGSEDQNKKAQAGNGEWYNVIPCKKLFIPVDQALVKKDTTFQLSPNRPIANQLNFNLEKKNAIYKNDLAILAIIAANNWRRPICFTNNNEINDLGLSKHLELYGMCHRLVPYETQGINKQWSYDVMMQKFRFGNASTPGVYFDEVNRSHLLSIRQTYAQLAKFLLGEAGMMKEQMPNSDSAKKAIDNNINMAKELLSKIDKGISDVNVPYGMTSGRGMANHNYVSLMLLEDALDAGMTEFAQKIKKQLATDIDQQWKFYSSLGSPYMPKNEIIKNLELIKKNTMGDFNKKQEGYLQDMMVCKQLEDEFNKISAKVPSGK